jgi:hypothetical protein
MPTGLPSGPKDCKNIHGKIIVDIPTIRQHPADPVICRLSPRGCR